MTENTAVQCCNSNAATERAPAATRIFTPRVDIVENETGVLLYADLPGVRPEDVDLRFEQGELTLVGKVQPRQRSGRVLFGEYEVGDTFFSRIAQEFEEETNAKIVDCQYLFVVENRMRLSGTLLQGLEHYVAVTLDREDITSRETHLAQHWLPLASLKDYDLRPWIVRDVIAEGRLQQVRHLVVPLDSDEHITEPD